MRAVLKQADFRWLFTGLIFSMTAESILLLALAIWVKSLTNSDGMAGATILALVLPSIFAPFVGYVVDRFRRKPFLVVVLLLSAVSLTPLLLVHDRSDVWIIYAVALADGFSYIAVSGALNGLIKEVVPDAQLAEANGALQTVKQGLRLFAPLAGAGLYTVTKGWGLAVVGMIGFIIAAAVISKLKLHEERPARSELHWLTEVGAGVKHLFGTPALRRGLIGMTTAVLVFGLSESIFFAFVDKGLHQPPTFLGVLVSIQGLGAVLGGLTAARIVKRVGEIGALALGVALFLPVILTSLVPSIYLAFPSMIACGVGLPYAIVGLSTMLQRLTPSALMGRASAGMDALISGPQALSIAAGAILVGMIDYRILLVGMAFVSTGAAIYLWTGRKLVSVQPAHDEPVGDRAGIRQAEATS